jgi:hypothetical protein
MTKTRATTALGPILLSTLACLLPVSAAQAYVGPGLSTGAAAVVLGILGSVVLALFALIWYPVKRMLKKGKSAPQANETKTQEV